MPALLSSLIEAPVGHLARALAPDDHGSRACLREWLARVPDPRSAMGRWHPLEYVLALAVCAFTAAGHDSPSAVAEWAAGCCQATLAVLGGRRDPWTRRVRPPSARTFARVFAGIDAEAFNAALYGWLAAVPASGAAPPRRLRRPGARRSCWSRRPRTARPSAARSAPTAARSTCCPSSTWAPAACGRSGRSTPRPTRSPSWPPRWRTWTSPAPSSPWTRCTPRRRPPATWPRTSRPSLPDDRQGQPAHAAGDVTQALAGPDSDFAEATWTEDGTGHGRRERRSIRTAPADGITWPHAAQVFRIRRDSGPTHGTWTHKEIAYGITSLPPRLAGPRHLGSYARRHWAVENREHYVRDKTFGEDLQHVRAGNQPNAYAAIRNLVIGAFRRAGYANIAHARRYYGRDDQRILALYGYT